MSWNLWDAAKAVWTGKFTVLNAYSRKRERAPINVNKGNSKVNWVIMRGRELSINAMENKKIINEMKSWLFGNNQLIIIDHNYKDKERRHTHEYINKQCITKWSCSHARSRGGAEVCLCGGGGEAASRAVTWAQSPALQWGGETIIWANVNSLKTRNCQDSTLRSYERR